MGIEKFLDIKYKLNTSENFDEFMKELGVGLLVRKMANTLTPTVTLTEKDGKYVLTTQSTFKTTIIQFKLGEEFDEETADGRTVKSVIELDGNKLTHTSKGEKETVIIREYDDKQMKATMTVGNVVCTRVYDRVD